MHSSKHHLNIWKNFDHSNILIKWLLHLAHFQDTYQYLITIKRQTVTRRWYNWYMVRAWRRSGITYPSRFVAFEHNEGRWTEHLFLRLVFYAACHNRVGIQQMLGCFFQTKWILIRKRRHFLVFYYPMLSPKVQHVFSWSFEDCKRYSTNSRADLNNYILNYM